MKHIRDWVTHIDNKEDAPYLRKPLPDVNMRLYSANSHYRAIVMAACEHLKRAALLKLDGYKLPHGISGANLGIPWNIIGYVRERGSDRAWVEIMINPTITSHSTSKVSSESNCGSIRLENPITIWRYEWVDVRWHNVDESISHRIFAREHCGFTIQHEIDHNLGILITDRQVK